MQIWGKGGREEGAQVRLMKGLGPFLVHILQGETA